MKKKKDREREDKIMTEAREWENKRGKDLESSTNMKHGRRRKGLMDGRYCFPLLKYLWNILFFK